MKTGKSMRKSRNLTDHDRRMGSLLCRRKRGRFCRVMTCSRLPVTVLMLISALMTCLLLPTAAFADEEDPVVLRVCNWEEYMDEGDWDKSDTIDLDSGDIFAENSMVEDFEEWYYETYGTRVEVEYTTFGTNEDLYNTLTLGDVYDVVCPSEYMIMKLMAEDRLQPLSEEFFDSSIEENYYIRGISPYINDIFMEQEINGEAWGEYMAGYMWGITGIVYNPEKVTDEEAGTWKILNNTKFKRQITVKDNVRDTYFGAVGAVKSDLLTSEEFLSDPDYKQNLEDEMNDVTPETIATVQDYLQDVKDNAYSFESDSGKADMMTGKVLANLQWSGDAVYTMDLAEEDGCELNFAVPQESTDIYFDGWVMLKDGIEQDSRKQQAAEAFMNFLSRPDNAIRNMYYIGYTSCISGGDDTRIFEYVDWTYGAEADEEDTVEYPLGYFFCGDNTAEDYILTVPEEQLERQLRAQYPDQDSINRSSIMIYFDQDAGKRINQMWINVRCMNLFDIPVWCWVVTLLLIGTVTAVLISRHIRKKKDYS